MDRRADPLCRAAEARIAPDEWYARSGCNLDGSHVAAKIAWVASERPAEDARTDRYPSRCLHGAGRVRRRRRRPVERLVDHGARPDLGTWDDHLLGAFGIDPARLPPVVGADEPVGEITAAFAADTGLPPATIVVCGCGDEMAATLGAGLAEPGSVCDVLGTAEPVCAVSDRPLRDRTQIAECHPHAAPGRWRSRHSPPSSG
jgi:xylulokinase